MKTPTAFALVSFLAISLGVGAQEVRWPKDVIEWKDFRAGAARALKEGKGVAFIFYLDGDALPPVIGGLAKQAWGTSEATQKAIKGLQKFCVIVRVSELEGVGLAVDPRLPKIVMQGRAKAGDNVPQVVVTDAGLENVVLTADGARIMSQNRKIFREAEKRLRELKAGKK